MPSCENTSPLLCLRSNKTRGSLCLLLSVYLLGVIGSIANAAIPSTERSVLVAIYNQTNGPRWDDSTNWNGPVGTECTWFGITCDDQQAHVISIVLTDNSLFGTLPPLDDLTALQSFNVASNYGGIASCFGLSSFTCNRLSGNLPSLSRLTALQTFIVSENLFTGSIPSFEGSGSLQNFHADGNNLSGEIPSLSGLRNLGVFAVQGNQLTGTIPELAGLSQLATFNVCTNKLTGPLPSFSGLINLQNFYACDNQLTGSIPPLDDVGQTSFIQIDVSHNQLTGAIPNLAIVKKLTSFFSQNNQLTGTISSLPEPLTFFDVSNNQLGGPMPSLPAFLVTFNASNNQLSGSIPSLGALSGLTEFEVENNRLTGSIPSLNGASNLGIIDVSDNQLSGSLPDLTQDRELIQFGAANNQLTGAIPDLTHAVGLQLLDVSNNRLTGTIPAIGSSNMRLFSVGFNKLTGPPPPLLVDPVYDGQFVSSLCPNQLTHSAAPGWDTVTRVSPWYRDCVTDFVNLDQVGLTGTWYGQVTSGQGFSLQIFPDILGAGRGLVSAGWLTYSGNTPPYGQRWYSVQGEADSGSPTASVAIGAPASAGSFDAPPRVSLERVGTATFAFSDCNHGTLAYSFLDNSYGISGLPYETATRGMIPLTRLTPNTNCTPQGGNGIPGSTSLLSGNWYDPATSGQGVIFDIAPNGNALFATWFTYVPATEQNDEPTFRNERWYTLQSGSVPPGATSLVDIPIFYTSNGEFDTPAAVMTPRTVQVGAADITFQSCTAMTLRYHFDNGPSGTLNLVRLGAAPQQCSL